MRDVSTLLHCVLDGFSFKSFFCVFDRLIEWCFKPLSTVFQSYHGDSLHYSALPWVSPVLSWGSEVSCPRTLPRKKPRELRLELKILDYESNTLQLSHAGPLCVIDPCDVKQAAKYHCKKYRPGQPAQSA